MAKRRAPTQSERALWHAAMRDVQPLVAGAAQPILAETPNPPQAVESRVEAQPTPIVPVPAGGIDGGTVARLRRGQVNVEARIDLHGMDQRAAFATLMGFVETSSRVGRRAVLIITGKGSVSQGGGVLRRNVPAWLKASPFAGRILTIEPAHHRHGGEGAFYVLLRRKRA